MATSLQLPCAMRSLHVSQVPPEYILVENVVGFEGSQTRDQLARSLATTKFCLQVLNLSRSLTTLGAPWGV
jgi:hypothetical protein